MRKLFCSPRRAAAGISALCALAFVSTLLKAAVPSVPSNAWAPTGDLTAARAGAAAALMYDGHVLVVGGLGASGAVLSSAERYSPDGGRFLATPSLETARANHTASLLQDGRVLVVGGVGASGQALASAELYDPQANAWTTIAPMYRARSGHSATALDDGRIVIAGGDDGGTPLDTIEIFNPATEHFELAASVLSAARTGHAAAQLHDGRVLVSGGFDGNGVVAAVDIFDPYSDSIVAGPSLLTARAGHSATTLLSGKVLVAGGAGASSELASGEVYDPAMNLFSAADNAMSAPRQRQLAILLPHNNQVLLVGGSAGGSATTAADVFVEWQGAHGTFFATSGPSAGRTWAAAAALSLSEALNQRTGPNDGLLLLSGGSASSGATQPLKSSELYGFATITTDKGDYLPGQTATISGGGWVPGETVTLTFVEQPALDTHGPFTAVADSAGRIVNTDLVLDEDDFNVSFYLTATGSQSQAQTFFKDSRSLTVTKSGTGLGTVTSSGGSGTINCGGTCSSSFGNTDTVTLTASATSGSTFTGWTFTSGTPNSPSAGCSTAGSTCSFGLNNNNITVQAAFEGNNQVGSVSVGSQTGAVTYGTAGSVSYTVTVNRGTSTGAFNATMSKGSLPSGVTASFSPNPVVFASGDSSKTSTMTVNTSATTTAMTSTAFTVTATNMLVSTDNKSNSGALTVGKRAITVTAATNTKNYDGTTTASATPNFAPALVNTDTAGFSEAYADKHAGSGKTLIPSGSVSDGNSGNNYSYTFVNNTTGVISTRAITVTAASASKGYDGTTSSSGTPTITSGSLASGDTVTWSQAYSTKHVGAGNKTLIPSGTVSDGNGGNDYAVTFVNNTTGTITARTITVTAASNSKQYDGTTSASATPSITSGSLAPGDSAAWSEAYSSKAVGSGNKTLVPAGTVSDGNSGNNYAVTFVNATNGTITAAPLSITGVTASSKVYDGGMSAPLNTGSAALSGVIGGDAVTLSAAGATGSFANKGVGTGKAVTVSGFSISGADAGNYSLSQPTGLTADITAKSVTVNGVSASGKVYDGQTAATLATGGATLAGVVGGDDVSLSTAGASGSFADKAVGTAKPVTVSGLTIGGADAANYSLTQPTGLTADITSKSLTVSGLSVNSKVYDGLTTATLNVGSAALVGVVGGDVVNLSAAGSNVSFADKTVGTAKAVTVSGLSITGADQANYSLTQPSGLTADITAKSLAATITADNKPYDGTAAATAHGSLGAGVVGGDAVSLVVSNAAFNSKTVGAGKSVSADLSLSGADAGNYTVNATTSTTANITAVALIGSMTADNKPYDGTTAATAHGSLGAGVVGGESVSLVVSNAAFGDKTAGNGKTVTAALSLSGADAGNYTVNASASTAADISPITLVGSMTADGKQYDGSTAATVHGSLGAGVVGGDVVSLVVSNAAFNSKTVGTSKPVAADLSLSGADAGNYHVNSTASATADITPVALTGSLTADDKAYDGTAAAVAHGSLGSGVVAGDTVTLVLSNQAFSSKSVGSGKAVTASLSLSGADAGNYTVNASAGATANITAATLTAAGVTAANKVYDGTMAATLNFGAANLVGVAGGDVVSLASGGATGAFSNKNVGGKPVGVSGLALAGADSANYVLAQVSGVTANITPIALTATITADNKPYDGTAAATAHGALGAGVLGGEAVTLVVSNAAFNNASIGDNKPVTASLSLSGADAGNYTVNASASTTANIAAITLTASFTNPLNGATNVDMGQPITWTTVPGVDAYYLYVGTTLGAKDVVNSGEIQVTSYRAINVPNGVTLYGRLWTKVAGVWRYVDITFTAASGGTLAFTYPAANQSTFDMSQPFAWSSVVNAQAYYLYVGTAPGGNDLVNSGELQGTQYLASNLPGGQLVYARLWVKVAGVWSCIDKSVTTSATTAQFTSPTNGASGVNVTNPFTWTTVSGAQAYYLYVGSSLGAYNLVNSGELATTSYVASTLPTGQLLYARLWTKVAGIWRYTDITFSAGTAVVVTATVTTPANGSTNVDSSALIQWTSVASAEKYYLYVGSTPGEKDLIDSEEICTGCKVSPMVTSWDPAIGGKGTGVVGHVSPGQQIYIRLWTMVGGVWRFVDSSYTIAN